MADKLRWGFLLIQPSIGTVALSITPTMLSFDAREFVGDLRRSNSRAREVLFRRRLPELKAATWQEVNSTRIIDTLLELVEEFECSGVVSPSSFIRL